MTRAAALFLGLVSTRTRTTLENSILCTKTRTGEGVYTEVSNKKPKSIQKDMEKDMEDFEDEEGDFEDEEGDGDNKDLPGGGTAGGQDEDDDDPNWFHVKYYRCSKNSDEWNAAYYARSGCTQPKCKEPKLPKESLDACKKRCKEENYNYYVQCYTQSGDVVML